MSWITCIFCFFIAACAHKPTPWQHAQRQKIIQEFCQQEGAFDRGFNDGKRGLELNLDLVKELCAEDPVHATTLYTKGHQQGQRFLNMPTTAASALYYCQLKIFEDQYQAQAPQRQQAIAKIIEQCRKEREDHFFCSDDTINCTLGTTGTTPGPGPYF